MRPSSCIERSASRSSRPVLRSCASMSFGLPDGDDRVALVHQRLDLREDRVDARAEVLALGRAAAEGLAHLARGAVLRLERAPDPHGLERRPGDAQHALAERERRRLDLLGEEDFLLLAEGRDLGDVAEVRHERAALARARRLARRVEPLRVDAHAADRAGAAHGRAVGLGAELVVGRDLAPRRPPLCLDRMVLVRIHLVSSHGGESHPGGPASSADRTLRSAPRVQAADMLCRFPLSMGDPAAPAPPRQHGQQPRASRRPPVTPHDRREPRRRGVGPAALSAPLCDASHQGTCVS